MTYLLDTDHITFLQQRSGAEYVALSRRMAPYAPTEFALSVISFHEQMLGAHNLVNRARSTADVVRAYTFLEQILPGYLIAPILPFDSAAATVFDQFRSQRLRLATMDLRIAAIALANGLILLTRNRVDFSRVPGLAIEDWTI